MEEADDVVADVPWCQCAAPLRFVQRQRLQRDERRGARLGRGAANLGTGVRVDRSVSLSGGHAADDVADGDAAGTLAPRLAQWG